MEIERGVTIGTMMNPPALELFEQRHALDIFQLGATNSP
jgi:hypothetical protein